TFQDANSTYQQYHVSSDNPIAVQKSVKGIVSTNSSSVDDRHNAAFPSFQNHIEVGIVRLGEIQYPLSWWCVSPLLLLAFYDIQYYKSRTNVPPFFTASWDSTDQYTLSATLVC